MGCVSSKKATPESPPFNFSRNESRRLDSSFRIKTRSGTSEKKEKEKEEQSVRRNNLELLKSNSSRKGAVENNVAFSFKIGKLTEAQYIAAGWPAWLTDVAGEAIEGWLPLRSENFERLEKIGQGTYSSVYRARDTETGQIVALKKVRFDNFQPESVRFMAREIAILRQLDHPNIMKLEGIITSRLSCSVYLVFEYMEHDLYGLLSCPDIEFSDAQLKCYMWQLLCGLEHCHSRGVLHRDIKVSNILVNNEGLLKIADFGLANFLITNPKQQLTSRVVTLWYRPPELLLGSTNYGTTVDLWSVGCVFAELFTGRPLLKGRTEVEQLHKIFKLCGSPPDEYWRRSKLPLAYIFKPQHPYESTLRERCKELPKTAVSLIETLLAIEPDKRGTASSALASEYFTTKPYACEPSSLPKYHPNKEIDAKFREEFRRKKIDTKVQASGMSRNPRRVRKTLQETSTLSRVVPAEDMEAGIHVVCGDYGGKVNLSKGQGVTESRATLKVPYDTLSEASQATEVNSIHSVPAMIASSGFAWARWKKLDAAPSTLQNQAALRRRQSLVSLEPSRVLLHENDTLDSEEQEDEYLSGHLQSGRLRDNDKITDLAIRRQRSHPHRKESLDSYNLFESEGILEYNNSNHQKPRARFSGPLLSHRPRIERRQESNAHFSSHFYRDS